MKVIFIRHYDVAFSYSCEGYDSHFLRCVYYMIRPFIRVIGFIAFQLKLRKGSVSLGVAQWLTREKSGPTPSLPGKPMNNPRVSKESTYFTLTQNYFDLFSEHFSNAAISRIFLNFLTSEILLIFFQHSIIFLAFFTNFFNLKKKESKRGV